MSKNMISFVFATLLVVAGCAKKPVEDVSTVRTVNEAVPTQSVAGPEVTAPSADTRADKAEASAGTGSALGTIYFDFDSWVLSPEARQILEDNARWLRQNAAVTIIVKGHTDERGSDAYNLALGERRARAAFNYLVAMGISPERLSVVSYGEEMPAEGGHEEGAWARNRRAEF